MVHGRHGTTFICVGLVYCKTTFSSNFVTDLAKSTTVWIEKHSPYSWVTGFVTALSRVLTRRIMGKTPPLLMQAVTKVCVGIWVKTNAASQSKP